MSGSAFIPIRCPCGQTLAITTESLGDHWVTIRNRDYQNVIRSEIRCRDLLATGGHSACGVGGDVRREFDDESQRIIDRSGNLMQCPHCSRLLWMPPGEPGYRYFCPEDGPRVLPG